MMEMKRLYKYFRWTLLTVILVILGHKIYLRTAHMETDCKDLFANGYFSSNQEWSPSRCNLHKFDTSEIQSCFAHSSRISDRKYHIVIIGDSRLRNILEIFQKSFDGFIAKYTKKPQHDIFWESTNLNVKITFLWYPLMNKTYVQCLENVTASLTDKPDFILMGVSLWNIGYRKGQFQDYRETLRFKLAPAISNILYGSSVKLIWMNQPVVLVKNLSFLNNDQIEIYNNAAYESLMKLQQESSNFKFITSFERFVEQSLTPLTEDGVHFSEFELNYFKDSFLSFLCSGFIDGGSKECCKPLEVITVPQILLIVVGTFGLVGLFILLAFFPFSSYLENIFASTTKLFLVLIFIFICEKTNIFELAKKLDFHCDGFIFSVFLCMILGLWFVESVEVGEDNLLNRHQTDEWKGWMQLIILLYHFTGGSQNLRIYIVMRYLVSSYIFLNGYGHAVYAIKAKKLDFKSVTKRFFKILIRMNFLFVMLCFVTNGHFNQYYFVPLITYFYVLQHLFSFGPSLLVPSVHFKQLYLLCSSLGLMVFNYWTITNEEMFALVFKIYPWEFPLASNDWTIDSWKSRLEIDLYSSLYGTIFAVGSEWILESICKRIILALLKFLSVICLAIYFIIFILSRTRQEYLFFHPVFIGPVIATFVYLRNSSTFLKQKYSKFFAFFGKFRIVSLPMPCLDVWKRTRSEFTNNPKSIAIVSVRQAFRLGKSLDHFEGLSIGQSYSDNKLIYFDKL